MEDGGDDVLSFEFSFEAAPWCFGVNFYSFLPFKNEIFSKRFKCE